MPDLIKEESSIINKSVWNTLTHLSNNKEELEIKEPEKEYTVPTLPKGKLITSENTNGVWIGNSRFDFVSEGLQLTLSRSQDIMNAEIKVIRDGDQIETRIINNKLQKDKLIFQFEDDKNRMREINIVNNGENLIGIIISTLGNYTKYDNIVFTKQ